MPTPNEMPMNDAPTTTMEQGNPYCFLANKAIDGWYDKDNNTFKGNLESNHDEDWILVELQGGQGYTITVDGSNRAGDAAGDTILTILDSKGNPVDLPVRTDDIAGSSISSSRTPFAENSVTFYNQDSGKYYISVKAYNRHPSLDNSGDYIITVEPTDIPGDIVGGDGNDKLQGTGADETIVGKGGHDVLLGGGGDDDLDGGDGDDLLEGGPGEDVLTGGKGEDTISYKYSAMMPAMGEEPDPEQKIRINLDGQLALGGDADGDEFGNDIENVEGAMFAENALTGDRRDNKLWGGMFADVLVGGSGDDKLYGMGGMDELEGGRGDDELVGGAHGDSLIGGAGSDTASYAGSSAPVTVRLHASQAMGGHAEGDMFDDMVTVEYAVFDDEDKETGRESETVPDIENLTGSGHDDILAGDSRDNVIMGGKGDDKIYGGPHGGNDELHGGDDDDEIFGGRGDDELHGGAGNDMLFGGKGADSFMGGFGDDKIFADDEDSTIDGWLEDQEDDPDTMDVDESIEAEADPRNSDTVSYERLGPRTSVTKTLGADGIINVENIIGGQGRDELTGDAGVNKIEGHDGGDTLNGGGDGTATDGTATAMADILSYELSDRGVSVTLRRADALSTFSAANAPLVTGGHASGDVFPDTGNGNTFQHVVGSKHDDDLTGDLNANRLWGGPGEDRLIGGAGADTVEGGPGADEMDGGGPGGDGSSAQDVASTGRSNVALGTDNNDTLSYELSTEAVNINLAALSFSGGDAEGDEVETFDWYHDDRTDTDPIELSTFEHVTGSANDDRLTGDVRANTLKGLGGRDDLRGGAEADTLMSGAGGTEDAPENLDGGSSRFNHDGTDTYDHDGDPNTAEISTPDVQHMDKADYSAMTARMGGIVVDLNDNTVSKGTNGANGADRLVNIERITGSGGDDTFIVSDDEDDNFIIDGGAGSDTLSFEFAADYPVKLELLLVDPDGTPGNADDFNIAHVPDDGTADTADDDLQGNNVFYNDTGTTAPTAVPTDEALYDLQYVEDKSDVLSGNQPGIHRAWNIENVTGSDFDDVIKGNGNQDNTFKGGAGDDTLVGHGGDDTLEGGNGNDELEGGDGSDMLMGGAGRDRLEGGDGIDLLRGDGGDDTLQGAAGTDDGDPDVFLFCVKDGRNVDTIEDFQISGDNPDKIDLRDFGIPDKEALLETMSITTDAAGGATTSKIIINLDDYGGGRIVIDNQDLANWDADGDGEIDADLITIDEISMDTNEDGMIFGDEIWSDDTGGTADTYDSGEVHDGLFLI